ncbi:unnamed protein product [Brachionus calyciflorus]|uniref:Uncharacterized protein n=1 Tax=Brachionus calyciflorus TaxID=104777 RepID=A0A813MKV4_9BILA|nr:unnamed protein product [Brachionus calyciflorus]
MLKLISLIFIISLNYSIFGSTQVQYALITSAQPAQQTPVYYQYSYQQPFYQTYYQYTPQEPTYYVYEPVYTAQPQTYYTVQEPVQQVLTVPTFQTFEASTLDDRCNPYSQSYDHYYCDSVTRHEYVGL